MPNPAESRRVRVVHIVPPVDHDPEAIDAMWRAYARATNQDDIPDTQQRWGMVAAYHALQAYMAKLADGPRVEEVDPQDSDR